MRSLRTKSEKGAGISLSSRAIEKRLSEVDRQLAQAKRTEELEVRVRRTITDLPRVLAHELTDADCQTL